MGPLRGIQGAIETMSNGLAKELAADGIRVNTVRGRCHQHRSAQGHGEDRLAQLLAMVPMKRMGEPDEVAAAAMWLLSAEASYVTGAILDVTGRL